MNIGLPSPPSLEGCTWRPLAVEDALALHELELDCAPVDGGTHLRTIEQYRGKLEKAGENLVTDTLCAMDPTAQLAATAWVTLSASLQHEYRAFLDGRVRPECRGRGLGTYILGWMEARASEMLAAFEESRPRVLRIDFFGRGEDAVALFEQHGFQFVFAEDEMRRDLNQPIPVLELPEGLTLVQWTPERVKMFFRVYQDAFRERPGFPNWTEDVWRHNFAGSSEFGADLSLLALDGAEPAGFAICHVESDEEEGSGSGGWIAQMGVRPAWRGRGLGSALLSEAMHRFRSKGLRWAMLEVNTNNPRARRFYERLGFEHRKTYTSFQKTTGQAEQG
jgi:mycothiol synthase